LTLQIWRDARSVRQRCDADQDNLRLQPGGAGDGRVK
jgi:hypothetical protein